MRRLGFALALTSTLLAQVAWAQVSRPRASPTPQRDASRIIGVIQPSAAPSCGYLQAGFYGDPGGCIYACTNGRISIVAGIGCVFPSPVASATAAPSPTPVPNL